MGVALSFFNLREEVFYPNIYVTSNFGQLAFPASITKWLNLFPLLTLLKLYRLSAGIQFGSNHYFIVIATTTFDFFPSSSTSACK